MNTSCWDESLMVVPVSIYRGLFPGVFSTIFCALSFVADEVPLDDSSRNQFSH